MVYGLVATLVVLAIVLAGYAMMLQVMAKVRQREQKWISRRDEIQAQLATEIRLSRAREQVLVEKLVEVASKPPVIIDAAETVKAIGESLSRVIIGPPEVAAERAKVDQQVAENWSLAMGGADPSHHPQFQPFGETDEWMNPDYQSPSGTPVNGDRVMAAAENGKGIRLGGKLGGKRPGEPIEFRSGEGGPPPVGGWE